MVKAADNAHYAPKHINDPRSYDKMKRYHVPGCGYLKGLGVTYTNEPLVGGTHGQDRLNSAHANPDMTGVYKGCKRILHKGNRQQALTHNNDQQEGLGPLV